ncbi:unnamed protein product [Lampetra fluviatilis]
MVNPLLLDEGLSLTPARSPDSLRRWSGAPRGAPGHHEGRQGQPPARRHGRGGRAEPGSGDSSRGSEDRERRLQRVPSNES